METNEKKTSTTSETVTISRAEYEDLKAQNRWLMEQLGLAKKQRFGQSSEHASDEVMEQMSLLFNEIEVYEDKREEQEKANPEQRKARIAHAGSVRAIAPKDIPVEVVEHMLPEEERECPTCGETMQVIGKDVRETLVLVPAKAYIQQDVYYTYACANCKCNGTETPVAKTPREASLIPGSYASPEAVAQIMTEKYVMYSPLYRQEQAWKGRNILLSRQTMSNWLIRCARDWLKPVYDELHRQLLQSEILHADETEVQVLHEQGKKVSSKSYMWLYRSGRYEPKQIVLYEYCTGRSGANPEAFLKGFRGYLQTDGYSGYNALTEVTRVGCWAHARRYFDEAVQALPKKSKTGAAIEGEAYCSMLFSIERELEGHTPEERFKERREREKPVLDAMESWLETRNAAPKSALGKALTYLRNQWADLTNVLLDGRLELSNNLAERSIKPFVMGRKNFLFMNTPGGAEASAVIYSVIETAKVNGLDPYRYLCHIFRTAPTLDRTAPDWIAPLLPENAPPECRK